MNALKTHNSLLLILVLLVMAPLNCSAENAAIENISAKAATALIENHRSDPDFIILDIRTPAEFQAGHISGAVMLDFYSKSFASDFKALDRGKTYLIYCRSGNRSGQLMRAISDLGFKKIYNMESGLKDWLRQGYKLTTS